MTDLSVKYFDTIPVANALTLLKNGLLFSCSEAGDQYLFKVLSVGKFSSFFVSCFSITVHSVTLLSGENDDSPECTTSSFVLKPEQDFVYFTPRPLRNLGQVDKLESTAPVLDMKVADIANEDAAQLFLVRISYLLFRCHIISRVFCLSRLAAVVHAPLSVFFVMALQSPTLLHRLSTEILLPFGQSRLTRAPNRTSISSYHLRIPL